MIIHISDSSTAAASYTGTKKSIERIRSGKGFKYQTKSGKLIKNKNTLERILKLRIPPAWKNVWISAQTNTALQATGFDARGRKQYIYHHTFNVRQSKEKYLRILKFAKALPKIRSKIKSDLARKNLDKRKVLAAIVCLMEMTLIRVGNDEYAKSNKSYGLTTLTDNHVKINGSKIEFRFLGKSKKQHSIKIKSKKLSLIVRLCKSLEGNELFQYLDQTGTVHDIKSIHVNAYLKEIAGDNFTAKDFRTWAGTVLAVEALSAFELSDSKAAVKRSVREAVQIVASKLGNTPAICLSSYIHPKIISAYLDGRLCTELKKHLKKKSGSTMQHFSAREIFVLDFLRKQLG